MNIVTDIIQLRKVTDFVEAGDSISDIVANLLQEMNDRGSLGFAANQLGYNARIFVMTMKPRPPICVVNPRVVKERGKQVGNERCESLPGVEVSIMRPHSIVVKGLNKYFKPVKYKLHGLPARIACHEIDHLCGKLITDYK